MSGDLSACTIVGGDFNPPPVGGVAVVDEAMATVDLRPVLDRRAPTLRLGALGFTLDHLYTIGANPLSAGVWPVTAASDHFPVWVVLDPC